MKRSLTIAVLVAVAGALISTPARAEWLASGLVVNPTTSTVIMEQVASIDITPRICVIGAASVTAQLRLQHRDATNTSTIKEQILPLGPTTANQFCFPDGETMFLAGERIRIIPLTNVTGTVSVSMLTDLN